MKVKEIALVAVYLLVAVGLLAGGSIMATPYLQNEVPFSWQRGVGLGMLVVGAFGLAIPWVLGQVLADQQRSWR